jgi:hypothetical protein
MSGTYPKATKFSIDALLMEEAILTGTKACIRCW